MRNSGTDRMMVFFYFFVILMITEVIARPTVQNGREMTSQTATADDSDDIVDDLNAEVLAVFQNVDMETGRLVETSQPVRADDTIDELESNEARRSDEDYSVPTIVTSGPTKSKSARRGIRRSRTHRRQQVHSEQVLDEQSTEAAGKPGRVSRHRRSAIGWIQAAVRMCDTGRSTDRRCRRIEVNDGRLHMSIRLEER